MSDKIKVFFEDLENESDKDHIWYDFLISVKFFIWASKNLWKTPKIYVHDNDKLFLAAENYSLQKKEYSIDFSILNNNLKF